MASLTGEVERRLLLVHRHVDAPPAFGGAGLDEGSDHAQVAVVGGVVQRRPVVAVLGTDFGTI